MKSKENGSDFMNTIALQQSQHLKKQAKFVKDKIKNNTKEEAQKRLIEAGILDKKGNLFTRYL